MSHEKLQIDNFDCLLSGFHLSEINDDVAGDGTFFCGNRGCLANFPDSIKEIGNVLARRVLVQIRDFQSGGGDHFDFSRLNLTGRLFDTVLGGTTTATTATALTISTGTTFPTWRTISLLTAAPFTTSSFAGSTRLAIPARLFRFGTGNEHLTSFEIGVVEF